MMPSAGEGNEGPKNKRAQAGRTVCHGADVSSNPSFASLFALHAQQQQLMSSNFGNQMLQFPTATQQWQQQQQQGQVRFGAVSNSANATASFSPPAEGAAAVPPSMLFLQDQLNLDYGGAMAAAVAMRNQGLFQGQTLAGPNAGLGMSSDSGADRRQAATASPSAAALNLSAEVTLLRQQQQQQRHYQERAAAAARATASNRQGTGPVDGGSLYLQERLGASSLGPAPSAQGKFSSFPSPGLSAFSNSSDLARALMSSRNNGMGSAVGLDAELGLSRMGSDASELSRMIMMLRGDFASNPATASTFSTSQSAISSGAPSSAETSLPRSGAIFPGGVRKEVTKTAPFKARGQVALKKRPPKPVSRVLKSVYRHAPASVPATVSMPYVLHSEEDDDHLTPYQCLLRKQLELFVADAEDVRCSSQQGRTTNIQVGQVGLRCRHCEGGLASRTKGAVYYSHSVDGIYQIGQNIGKVHLAERCYRIPDVIRRELVVLRNDSRRASSGKAYWSDRIRALGVYEEGKILKYRNNVEETDGIATAKSDLGGASSTSKDVGKATQPSIKDDIMEKPYGESDRSIGMRVSKTEETGPSIAENPGSSY